jgi:acetyltransferase-like isoleucine patch superfamily enzyme
VTRDIPANCLAVGNPARVVRQFDGLNGLQRG